jgi:hypothetical protein
MAISNRVQQQEWFSPSCVEFLRQRQQNISHTIERAISSGRFNDGMMVLPLSPEAAVD